MKKDAKIIVTGARGQLGYDCVRELKERGYTNLLAIDREELDLTDERATREFFLREKPTVVMHNAAWTAVDKAEACPEAVYAINALGTKYIASACAETGAKMVYISTDYVFDGKGEAYFETWDRKNGLSVYGRTKALGETFVSFALEAYFIVRISWVFGINGGNFVKTMLRLADEGARDLDVVSDQIGSPTYTLDLAKLLCDMIETEKYGVYHATNEGICSWAEFASHIFQVAGKDVRVHPLSTEEYRRRFNVPADRPLNSRLSKSSLDEAGFSRLPDWKDAVERYIRKELKR